MTRDRDEEADDPSPPLLEEINIPGLGSSQDQSKVLEERCGFEMLSEDVNISRYFRSETLSEAIEENRSAVCCRQTTSGQDWCDWHSEADIGNCKDIENDHTFVLDGAKLNKITSNMSLQKTKCRYADFSGVNLNSADFSNSDLTNADLSDTYLYDIESQKTGTLDSVHDTESQETGALPPVHVDYPVGRPNLSGADLQGADLQRADLPGTDFSEANIKSTDFSNSYLNHSSFSENTLSNSDFLKADLNNVNFSEVAFFGVSFIESDITAADFSEASFFASEFLRADLIRADLSNAYIKGENLFGANLSDTTAKNTNFRNANFGDSDTDHPPTNLENAVFRNADLRGADFTDARLDQIDLTDARIDAQTEFDAETIYERDEDVTSEVRDDGDDAVPPSVWVHRRLERLHEENALSSVARKFHIRKQRARRKHRRREGEWLGWAWLTLLGATMGYGEKPERVLGTAGAVVGLWTLLYPIGAWIVPNPGTPEATQRGLDDGTSAAAAAVRYPSLPNNLAAIPSYLDGLASTLADSIYFSTVTFTTLGFGDFSPVGFGRVLATVESALGVTLFAVLVFVLGRRATR